MRIGIGLPNTATGTRGPEIVDWARRADAAGFSALATIGRVAYPSLDSLVSLAAAAAVTERVELFTNILLAPTRDPVLLAKEAATIDRISGGRMLLGVGVGTRRDDFELVGVDFETRGSRTDEMLETMGRLWRGEVPDGATLPVTPSPVRPDGIPIMIGGSSEAAIRRTVRFGAGWTAGGSGPEQAASFAERVRAAWSEAGHPGEPRIMALAYFSIGEGDRARRSILDYYAYFGGAERGFAESIPTSVEAVRETVGRFEDAGIDDLILDPTVSDPDQVDRLAEAVL
ncbi:MAG: TIGR03619 family F420-dependent LLM class oxidoreductase [Actinobacteria bacterium]|nr:TIGR03619 family F420-dependent LLM class oxidoreductase [Actinomycetota bacterium]